VPGVPAASRLFSTLGLQGNKCRHACRHGRQECPRHDCFWKLVQIGAVRNAG
jgi:hypothetical protein